MMKKVIFGFTGVLLILIFTGCAGGRYLTTRFQEVSNIPEGKALVYIYRTKTFGSAVHHTVNVNESTVSDFHLYPKGYLVYYADPGENRFWAEIAGLDTEVILNVEAGKTYYIEGSIKMGVVVGRPYLEIQDPEKGSRDVRRCKLIGDNSP